MDDLTLDDALEDLESAEDFLNYFDVGFDPAVVHVNRLHILQRYHNYLAQAGALPESEAARREVYTTLLTRAYQDFVASDALTEKVFKVFRMHEPQTAFVPLSSITLASPHASAPIPAAGGCGCGNTGSCHSSESALRS
ncbi:MAG: nitrogen fixation protein NifW [Hydrogenophilales bacterium 28-61-23]|nr:MAG: nitrogen fixation protein NifW [Hydrogenophilales bacterium 28-61-23]